MLKKAKSEPTEQLLFILRITIDGNPKEIASKRYIEPEKWESKLQKVSGTSIEVKEINAYLKTLEREVYDAHHEMMKDKNLVTSEKVKAKVLGVNEKGRMLIPIFQEHNNRIASLVVKEEYAEGTLERYKTSLKHTQDFLKWKFKTADIDIRNIGQCLCF